jgi:hypothetical protein
MFLRNVGSMFTDYTALFLRLPIRISDTLVPPGVFLRAEGGTSLPKGGTSLPKGEPVSQRGQPQNLFTNLLLRR